MRKLTIVFVFVLALVLGVGPASADPITLYVDDDDPTCGGNSPCYAHPQDAVNSANPGDTILVYPGTYNSRYFVCNPIQPTWCSPNDNWAPALIVYKDGLTIKSVEGPGNTIIQSTHTFWSNAIAVQNSTNQGITGISGWNPSAVIIVANNVTIEGFTFHRPFNCSSTNDCFWNTAGVFIGSKGAGYSDFLGHANGATVKNNIFSNVWHAVFIWHSSGNKILNNTVEALGNTGHWAAISSYDGWDNASVALGNLSENNTYSGNSVADKGISLGAWAPSAWTSNADCKVCNNTTTQVGVAYAHGPVIVGCNMGGFWVSNTDDVLRVTGISYTGDVGVFPFGTPVDLGAQLSYDGSSDGSGVEVEFIVGDQIFAATTGTGGNTSTSVNLPVGVYEVQGKVTVCTDCIFTTDTQFLVVYDPSAGFVTGGGWIDSPEIAVPPQETTVYFNGFETDIEGWFTPNRVSSGTNGITSASGNYHAQAVTDDFTRWGGYNSIFPSGGFITAIDVYLDMGAGYANDTRFDWSSAISAPDGSHRRDFIFNGGFYNDATEPGAGVNRFVFSASNNAPGWPKNPGRDPIAITTTGWYTLQHRFYDDGTGVLAVDLSILDSTGSEVHTWTLSDPSDIIDVTVGGNRYGWLVTNGFPFLAIDNSIRKEFFSTIGKATFGFVSKYQKGANAPSGNTEFQFKAGNLNFHSDVQEWLVVNQGGTNAQFKGSGTINNELAPNGEPYKFMIWAGDGDPDTFRIKIWWEEDGVETVVYDNGTVQPIGGGSIVIHTGK